MKEINLSKRRTQNVMQRLNEIGKGHGFTIQVIKNRGYSLLVTDADLFANFVITSDSSSFEYDQNNRVLLEIMILLNETNFATPIGIFSDIIGVTIEELYNDLDIVQKYLEKCELKLEISEDAVLIHGSEFDKRTLLVRIREEFSHVISVKRLLPYYLSHDDKQIISKILEDSGISLTPNKMGRFVNHLDILILRLFQENTLDDFHVNMLRMDYRSEEAVIRIRSIIESLFSIHLERRDVSMLTYLLSEDIL